MRRPFQPNPYFLAILMGCLALAIYLKNGRVVSTVGFQDTEPAHLLAISVVTEGNLYLDEFVDAQGVLPLGTTWRGGHVVSNYPIVPALLNVPVYAAARSLGMDLYAQRYWLSLITAATIAALSVTFMVLVLSLMCQRWTSVVLGGLIYTLGTPVWSVASQGLWQHGPSLLFITAAFWFLLKNPPRWIPLAGFFLGMAVFNRPPNALLAAALAIYVWRVYRASFVKFALLGALPLISMAVYSATALGSIFALGQTQDVSLFTGDVFSGLPGLLISPSRGLFIFSPVMIFAAGYVVYALFSRRVTPFLKYLAVSTLLLVLVYAFWYQWWGGASFSYRLLIETLPMLTIFLALCWEQVIAPRWYLQVLFWPAVLVSFYTHYLGAYYYPCGFNNLPQHINVQTWRLWDWQDSELTRCTRSLLEVLRIVH